MKNKTEFHCRKVRYFIKCPCFTMVMQCNDVLLLSFYLNLENLNTQVITIVSEIPNV